MKNLRVSGGTRGPDREGEDEVALGGGRRRGCGDFEPRFLQIT